MVESERIELVILGQVERSVRYTFEKRFSGKQMSYEMARELVWLEREIMENVGAELRSRAEPSDEDYVRDLERVNTNLARDLVELQSKTRKPPSA